MPALISLSKLDFAYSRALVLKGLDLTVEAGSTMGVIGPNGGGKTTLVKLLTGRLQPTRGSILIDGLRPLDAVRRGDRIGYLPQNPQVDVTFPINVRQTITLGLAGKTGMLRGYSAADRAYADSLMDRIGIAELADTPIGELSGGQLQRVLIARALVAKPKLLILDEPTTGIDVRGQKAFIEFIAAIKQELGLTVVFVSHDLRAVTSMSDRIACLNVTLHYHDVPQHLPADLVYRMFACDLEAAGIKSTAGPVTGPFLPLVGK
ncbi:metal ABC transporter ATP-binding protein [soil metagenome]